MSKVKTNGRGPEVALFGPDFRYEVLTWDRRRGNFPITAGYCTRAASRHSHFDFVAALPTLLKRRDVFQRCVTDRLYDHDTRLHPPYGCRINHVTAFRREGSVQRDDVRLGTTGNPSSETLPSRTRV